MNAPNPTMQAMVLHAPHERLQLESRPLAQPGAGEVRLRVAACGVCRTDLHITDGELACPHWPVIPGHEIVGFVDAIGADVQSPKVGDYVGVPWLAQTCGECSDCRAGRENLCHLAVFTGHGRDGGYATHTLARANACIALPAQLDPLHAAPLLCAGLIGWRALRMAGDAQRLGLYGFGASAHLLAQVAQKQGRAVYAFTRPGDAAGQAFARSLGATWAGDSDKPAPDPLDAALIFAPAGELVPLALAAVRPGGRVVCAGIHMSNIPAFAYALLWGERSVQSVANLTRRDAQEFFEFVTHAPLQVRAKRYPLHEANEALDDLRRGEVEGAAVLVN